MSRARPAQETASVSRGTGRGSGLTPLLMRFAGAGAFGTLAHYAVLIGLVRGGLTDAWWASVTGSVLGAHINYLLNYHWTYREPVGHRRAYPRFMLVALLGLALNAVCMHLLVRHTGLHYLLSQLISTAVVFAVGFALNTLWTFRRPT